MSISWKSFSHKTQVLHGLFKMTRGIGHWRSSVFYYFCAKIKGLPSNTWSSLCSICCHWRHTIKKYKKVDSVIIKCLPQSCDSRVKAEVHNDHQHWRRYIYIKSSFSVVIAVEKGVSSRDLKYTKEIYCVSMKVSNVGSESKGCIIAGDLRQ